MDRHNGKIEIQTLVNRYPYTRMFILGNTYAYRESVNRMSLMS